MLLALDTATSRVSVAVYEDRVLAEQHVEERLRHAETLAPAVQEVLGRAGARPTDLSGVAVGVGPGPYTGLRVGLATARTLAWTLGIPAYGVCSLDVLAAEAATDGHGERELVVATDARRKEVYVARYQAGARVDDPQVLRPADAATQTPVVGEGGRLYPEDFPATSAPWHPSAAVLAVMVAEGRASLLPTEPLYLRRPDVMAPRPPKRVS